MKNTFCMIKVEREHAAEVRDLFKAAANVTYHRMNVMRDKAYKVLHVSGDLDAIINTAANVNYVTDILTY